MRVLCLGRSGQVAQALSRAGAAASDITLETAGRERADLSVPGEGARLVREVAPDVVINAAAWTAVDAAETHEAEARRLNALAPGELAAAARDVGARFITLSTDYVFDGSKDGPWLESDPVGPVSAYGRTKLEGEQLTLASDPEALVLRTAWVYGPIGQNFVRTMLRLAAARDELRVVADQTGNPTSADDIAEAVLCLARLARSGEVGGGIYHMAGRGETDWAGFARAILSASGRLGGPTAHVVPITTADYPTPARRPANSRLDCSKLQCIAGISLAHWSDSLGRCMATIAASGDWPG
jgi:dTDP-4-dehydrorhamnose reductase